MTTGKTIALTRQTFVGKVMSLLLNMLSRLVITFLPSSSESKVAQSCLTLCDPMDCSLPGSSIHEILQARILECIAISLSRGSSQPRDLTQVSHTAGRSFNLWATREAARSKCLLISWLQSPSAVVLKPPKIKSDTVSTVSPSIAMKWWDQMPWSPFSECWTLSQLFHSPLSLSSRGFLVPLHFLP